MSLPQKDKSRFIKFDIVEFYLSISEELLNCSISFARSVTTISDSVINLINHSKKSLPFDKRSAWVKKKNNSLMLRWNFMMERKFVSKSTVIDKSGVDLYRDDGLATINNANGPKFGRIRKDIIA